MSRPRGRGPLRGVQPKFHGAKRASFRHLRSPAARRPRFEPAKRHESVNDALVRDPNASAGRYRRILASALFGVAFGLLFPLVSTVIALLDHELSFGWGQVWSLHRTSPLLQVIDTIPLLLGLVSALLGRAMARLDEFIENLEGTVVQRDLVLQRAQLQASTARKAKGALLGRFLKQIRQQYGKGEPALKELLDAGLPLELQRSLKAVARAQKRVQATLWSLDMLAFVESDASGEEKPQRCSITSLCEGLAEAVSQRETGGIRYKIVADEGVPEEVWICKESLSRSLTCLLGCAIAPSSQKQVEISLSHFAAIHGGTSKLHVALRNPCTPTTGSVVRSFSDLDPKLSGSAERGELELALCRQLALVHEAEVGVRPDPKGGMCFWMFFPYLDEEGAIALSKKSEVCESDARGQAETGDSQEMVQTRVNVA